MQNKYSLLWCRSVEQPTSDSQILPLAQLPSSENFVYILRQLPKVDCDRKLLDGQTDRQTDTD